jgi:hypothetical protein
MTSLLSSHWLRLVVATATTLSPIAQIQADEPAPVAHLTPQSFAAVTVRLANAAKSPVVQQYPVEVLAAATKDFLGIPLGAIDRVTAMVEPPMGVNPQYAVVLQSSRPIAFEKFRKEVTEHTTPGELLGRPLLESNQDLMPSFCLLDDQTLAVGPKLFLKRLVRGVKPSQSDLQSFMSTEDATLNDLHGVLTLEPLRPLIEIGLAAAKKEAEPEAHQFLDGVLLLDRVVVTADLSGERGASLVAHATSPEAADRLEQLMAEGYSLFRTKLLEDEDFQKNVRNSPEAVVRAWGDYCLRSMDAQALALGELRQGQDTFVLGHIEPGGPEQYLTSIAVVGVLVGLLLPAVQAAREAARRNTSMNNLKQILLSLLNHESTFNRFPAQAICDAEGKPLLSWRVAILPFIEQAALYDRFHLDEPWDSPHNLPLLAEMPEIFIDPSSPGLTTVDGKTHYLAVSGAGTAFTGKPEGTKLKEFSDGTSRSAVVIQVNDANAVEWTKPTDYDTATHAATPTAGIGELHPGSFLTGFADGHIVATPMSITPEAFAAGASIAGGETTEWP